MTEVCIFTSNGAEASQAAHQDQPATKSALRAYEKLFGRGAAIHPSKTGLPS